MPYQAKAESSSSTSGTATTNGIYSDDKDHDKDTFSATKTRFTCTTPSQSAARGLDSSLKEIDSKDRSKTEEDKEGKEEVGWGRIFVPVFVGLSF